MSDLSLEVVEIAYDDEGNAIAHIEGWGPVATATMQTAPAGGRDVAMVTTDRTPEEVAAVKADIEGRIAAGSSTPVTKAHLDDLGITAAVLQWAGG